MPIGDLTHQLLLSKYRERGTCHEMPRFLGHKGTNRGVMGHLQKEKPLEFKGFSVQNYWSGREDSNL